MDEITICATLSDDGETVYRIQQGDLVLYVDRPTVILHRECSLIQQYLRCTRA